MQETQNRILAIDPIHKGLGYAVFEPPRHLVACGISRVKGDKQTGAVAKFEKLLTDFRPDTVVLEDTKAPGSRRRHRVRELIKKLATCASDRGVTVGSVSRSAVIECFSSPDERATKYSIAKWLVETFPELCLKLPKPRRAWDSEDERMSVFDALALAVTYASK